MTRVKVTLSLDEKIWRKFKKKCAVDEVVPSYVVEEFMDGFVKPLKKR